MPVQQDIRQRLAEQYSSTLDTEGKKFFRQAGGADKFKVSTFAYPSNLGEGDLQHYVEFQINVRGKSKFNKDKQLFQVQKQSDASFSAKQLATAVTVGAAAIGGGLAIGAARKIRDKLKKSGADKGPGQSKTPQAANPEAAKGPSSAQAGALGATAGAAISADQLLTPDTLYRISDVIALYMDAPPAVRYNMNYSNRDLGTIAGILANAAGVLTGKATDEVFTAAALALSKSAGQVFGLDVPGIAGAGAGVVLNPVRTVLFEAVDFRTFAFNYKFMPKDPGEVKTVKDIIKLFKFHMHPEMSENKLFFVYPSEFQITYYFGSIQNPYFHKFTSCVLENVEITYGGEQFSSFRTGEPTEINMKLTFKETEILTKDMIEKGY